MISQEISYLDSIDSPMKRSNRVLYILEFIEFIFISICFLLLLLNQNLNNIVDNYSPAYKILDEDDTYSPTTSNSPTSDAPKTTDPPTTANAPKATDSPTTAEATKTMKSSMTTSPTTHSLFRKNPRVFNPKSERTKIPPAAHPKEETVKMPIPKKIPAKYSATLHPMTGVRNTRGSGVSEILNNYLKANDRDLNINEGNYKQEVNGSYLKTNEPMVESATKKLTEDPKTATPLKPQPKEDWIKVFISNLTPGGGSLKVKRDRNYTDEREQNKTQSRLTDLLIMYPCCIAAITIVCMQMLARLAKDIVFKSTVILFLVASLGLGLIIFAVSIVESVIYVNTITILVAVSSAIFLIIVVIEFILLFSVT